MQRRAIEELTRLLRDKLAAAEIPAAEMRGYVTPRRLTVIAEGDPRRSRIVTEERRGPGVGAPPPAIEGFLRVGRARPIEACEELATTGRGEFYFAASTGAGRPAAEVSAGAGKVGDLGCRGPNRCVTRLRRCAGSGR